MESRVFKGILLDVIVPSEVGGCLFDLCLAEVKLRFKMIEWDKDYEQKRRCKACYQSMRKKEVHQRAYQDRILVEEGRNSKEHKC